MKLIVEKHGEIVKAIKAEYTPVEALIINQAMRRYVNDEEVNEDNRAAMGQMLDVNPIFVDKAEREDSVLDKIRAEIKQLPYQRIFGNVSSYSLLDTVVEIIDKYKAESEKE